MQPNTRLSAAPELYYIIYTCCVVDMVRRDYNIALQPGRRPPISLTRRGYPRRRSGRSSPVIGLGKSRLVITAAFREFQSEFINERTTASLPRSTRTYIYIYLLYATLRFRPVCAKPDRSAFSSVTHRVVPVIVRRRFASYIGTTTYIFSFRHISYFCFDF